MMTDEAPPTDAATERLPYDELRRATAHRTSDPTNELVRAECWTVQVARNGVAPYADAVILAALRLAGRHRDEWHREILAVEAGVFSQKRRPPRDE